jgi:hypothetical protein
VRAGAGVERHFWQDPHVVNRRRLIWSLPIALLVVAIGYTVWLVWQVQGDLRDVDDSASRLQSALGGSDRSARDQAVEDLRTASESANSRTSGAWWGSLTHLPLVGDDATGVRALSRSVAIITKDAVGPLAETVDQLDELSHDGRIDVDVVKRLDGPLAQARAAFDVADDDVSGLDSTGYAGPLKSRFAKYVDLIGRTAGALSAAEKAVQVLPTMVGADGPRDYLLIFQNNAEIRATGGMPGSWALLHADRGRLTLSKQGTADDFPVLHDPVLPMSDSERAVYDRPLGIYWQDAGFTPDYPRAAELWSARWDLKFPEVPLDGVIALDPVGLSYLMEGTGPVQVGATTLTSDNLLEELLNKPYLTLAPTEQNTLFQRAAKAIFEASTRELASPLGFVQGLHRAATEGRFLVASFDERVRADLAGTRVEDALATDDGTTPHVDVGLNDATGSKMSYYLRYWAEVHAAACDGQKQGLVGAMTLNQAISPAAAAQLPLSVTGGGIHGTEPGSQLVLVRIYGPTAGTVEDVKLNGRTLRYLDTVELGGRPVATVVVLLSNRADAVLTWSMNTGPNQVGDTLLRVTPSIVPGNNDAIVKSAC